MKPGIHPENRRGRVEKFTKRFGQDVKGSTLRKSRKKGAPDAR